MRLILFLLATQSCLAQSVAMPGPGISRVGAWPNGYSFRRSITIDHTKVPTSNQSDFPVLLCFNGGTGTNCDAANSNTVLANLKTTGNLGQIQHTVSISTPYTHTIPADMIITDTDGSTVLPFEVVTYSASTGLIEIWVKVGTLTTGSDYVLYIYYGNASVSTDQSSPASVWSAYKAAYHFADGATLGVVDSTTNNGFTNHSATAVAGEIDGGAAFSGTSQYMQSTSAINLSSSNILTVEFWLKWTTFANNDLLLYESGATFFSTDGGIFADPNESSTGKFEFATAQTLGVVINSAEFTRPSAGAWHHYVVVMDRTALTSALQWKIYVDGSVVTFTQLNTGIPTSNFANATLNIMCRNAVSLFGAGSLDEFRMTSGTARTASYAATAYNNQNSPNTFYTLGAEQ